MTTKIKSIMIVAAAAAAVIAALYFWLSQAAWRQQDHDNLDQRAALALAEVELTRITRKKDAHSSEEAILSDPCLVASTKTAKLKMFVFEFRNRQTSILRTIYVASSPGNLEVEMAPNAEPRPDGSPSWADPILNCGRNQP